MKTVRIVLVRPRNPVNIGAVARAMANFGFGELVVVGPHPPVWEEARRAAFAGETVLERARVVPSLREAVKGCTLVAGTDSGTRRRLDHPVIEPAAFRPNGPTALVFGSEKTGLSNEDLSYCHLLVRIPTAPGAPSMNLAQAVAVCCYELRRKPARNVGARLAVPTVPAVEKVHRLLEIAAPVLEASGFFDARTRAARMRKLRRIVLRAGLSAEDVALLTAASRRLAHNFRLRSTQDSRL